MPRSSPITAAPPQAPVYDTENCCKHTPVGVWVQETLIDVQIVHWCGRLREHVRPADWLATR